VGKYIVKGIIAVLVLSVIAVIAGVWMVWKRPLTVDAWMSRMALQINGLKSRELTTDAGRMTVWEGGSGPTMVLLHGAGDQAGAWARTVGGLVTDHRLVIPDLPGHWKSDPRSGPIHMAQLLDGLDRVMDDCCPDGEPVVIVGNSLGAWLGFLYARDNPERVARLVAVNGGPLLEPNPQVNLFPTTRDEARETMKGLMGPASPPIPGYVLDDIVRRTDTGPAARFAATAGEMGGYLLDGRLGEVTVPVELVWGAADQLLTLDYAQRMVEGLPTARLHPIKGCGHVPERECPLQFLEVLTGALEEPLPPPADETEGDDAADDATTGSGPNQQAGSLLHNGNHKAERLLHNEGHKAGSVFPNGDQQAGSMLHYGGRQSGWVPRRDFGALWGRHPACQTGCVLKKGAASDRDSVILSERSESKDPHRLSSAHVATDGLVFWGDSSTHSRTRSLRMTGCEGSVIPYGGAVTGSGRAA